MLKILFADIGIDLYHIYAILYKGYNEKSMMVITINN